MVEHEPYLTAAGVESAIKDAAKKAAAADRSLDLSKRIQLETSTVPEPGVFRWRRLPVGPERRHGHPRKGAVDTSDPVTSTCTAKASPSRRPSTS